MRATSSRWPGWSSSLRRSSAELLIVERRLRTSCECIDRSRMSELTVSVGLRAIIVFLRISQEAFDDLPALADRERLGQEGWAEHVASESFQEAVDRHRRDEEKGHLREPEPAKLPEIEAAPLA